MKIQLREIGMLRVAAVSPELRVGDIAFNLKAIIAAVCANRAQPGPPGPMATYAYNVHKGETSISPFFLSNQDLERK